MRRRGWGWVRWGMWEEGIPPLPPRKQGGIRGGASGGDKRGGNVLTQRGWGRQTHNSGYSHPRGGGHILRVVVVDRAVGSPLRHSQGTGNGCADGPMPCSYSQLRNRCLYRMRGKRGHKRRISHKKE